MSNQRPVSVAKYGIDVGLAVPRSREMRELKLTPIEMQSDEELVALLQVGHTDALGILFDRYHRLVLSVSRKILRDSGEAEDLMQAVFCEIFQSAAQFDPLRGSTKTWILQFSYSRSLNRKQYLKTRSFYDEKDFDPSTLSKAPAGATPGLTGPEARRLVQQCLALLNQPQRMTLELAFFEGLSMAEIAGRRKESVVTIRHHYYRGLQKLRGFLHGESSKESPKEFCQSTT
jgi:RNA polymerase sigma-70 factor (ECF subfamily)